MIIQNKFIFKSFKEFLIDSLILSAKKLENKINELYLEEINSTDFNHVVCHKCKATLSISHHLDFYVIFYFLCLIKTLILIIKNN